VEEAEAVAVAVEAVEAVEVEVEAVEEAVEVDLRR
jgi:hypothetical protein